jgi:hypothetical protein
LAQRESASFTPYRSSPMDRATCRLTFPGGEAAPSWGNRVNRASSAPREGTHASAGEVAAWRCERCVSERASFSMR